MVETNAAKSLLVLVVAVELYLNVVVNLIEITSGSTTSGLIELTT